MTSLELLKIIPRNPTLYWSEEAEREMNAHYHG